MQTEVLQETETVGGEGVWPASTVWELVPGLPVQCLSHRFCLRMHKVGGCLVLSWMGSTKGGGTRGGALLYWSTASSPCCLPHHHLWLKSQAVSGTVRPGPGHGS